MAHERLQELRREVFTALRPPAKLDMADWIQRTVRLPSTVAAQSGPMRLFPYQMEIARSIGDPNVERVSIMKSARVGMSQLMVAGIGHFALNDPTSQLVVLPSESDCRMMMTAVVEPTFAASPALRSVLLEDVNGRDTLYSRQYPGGHLALVSGGSPKNLRARTARVIWLDEVDGLEVSAGNEGDPVELAIRRSMTFADRKVVLMSTPVDEATSRIAPAFEAGDQRMWECPCPHCATFTEVRWSDIKWPSGEPAKAFWACPSCGGIVEESGKAAFVNAGRWRATRPDVAGHHSYRLNSLISTIPNAAWGRLASEFAAAHKDANLLKTFINTVLGEVWRGDAEGLDSDNLLARREPIGLDRIPVECIAITGGVDVQHDRVELTTMGWSADAAPMILAHEIVWGDPFGSELWLELDAMLKRQFRHPLAGAMLKYDAVLIDSGDGTTVDRVYDYTRGRASARVFPSKGVSGFQQPTVQLGQARNKTVRLQLVGVDSVKVRLANMASSGSLRLSDILTPAWAEQFTCERLETRYQRGVPIRQWHRLGGRRAEAWDCACYSIAAFNVAGINVDRRQMELATAAAPKPRQNIVRSSWIERR